MRRKVLIYVSFNRKPWKDRTILERGREELEPGDTLQVSLKCSVRFKDTTTANWMVVCR